MAIFDSDEIVIFSLVTCGLQQLQLPSCLKGKPPINPVVIHQQTTLSPTPPSSSQWECGQNPYKHFLIVFAVLLIIKPNREVSKKEDDVNLILTKVSMIINTKVIIIITKMVIHNDHHSNNLPPHRQAPDALQDKTTHTSSSGNSLQTFPRKYFLKILAPQFLPQISSQVLAPTLLTCLLVWRDFPLLWLPIVFVSKISVVKYGSFLQDLSFGHFKVKSCKNIPKLAKVMSLNWGIEPK